MVMWFLRQLICRHCSRRLKPVSGSTHPKSRGRVRTKAIKYQAVSISYGNSRDWRHAHLQKSPCPFKRGDPERWPSGLRRTLGKRVCGNVPWVRIPLSPPIVRFCTPNYDFVRFRALGFVEQAEKLVKQFCVKAPGLTASMSALSGGNVQRAVLARELTQNVRLLIASNPTFGLRFRRLRRNVPPDR